MVYGLKRIVNMAVFGSIPIHGRLIKENTMTKESMLIERVTFENVANIEQEIWTPGEINFRLGRNGSGKSSGIDAISAILSGRGTRELVTVGAKKGKIELHFANGDEAQMTIYPDKSPTFVYKRDGRAVSSPREAIGAFLSSMNIDMSAWLDGGVKERTDLIIESVPFELDFTELEEIITDAESSTKLPKEGTPPLEAINAVERDLMDDIHAKKIELLTKKNHISETMKKITEDYDSQWKPDLDRLDNEIQEANSSYNALRSEVESKHNQEKDVLENDWKTIAEGAEDVRKAGLKTLADDLATREAHIAKLKDELHQAQSEYDKHKNEIETSLELEYKTAVNRNEINLQKIEIDGKRDKELAELELKSQERINEIQLEKAEVKRRIEVQERNKAYSEAVADAQEKLQHIEDIQKLLKEGRIRITDLKQRMFANCPIEGLEIIDDEIYLGGIRVDRVNRADLFKLSLQIANLKSFPGGIRTVIVDNAECLDAESRKQFIEMARGYDLQVFATVATDGELKNVVVDDDGSGIEPTATQGELL